MKMFTSYGHYEEARINHRFFYDFGLVPLNFAYLIQIK